MLLPECLTAVLKVKTYNQHIIITKDGHCFHRGFSVDFLLLLLVLGFSFCLFGLRFVLFCFKAILS